MIKLSVLFTLLLFVPSVIKAQTHDKVIAKIGNISISEKEFTARYELTPLPGLHSKKMGEALIENFLYSLIAEKLFALDAMEQRIDTNDIVAYSLKSFEKMFVRDALYKELISDKAKAKANDLLNRYIDEASEFWLVYIFSADKSESEKIYNLLKKGIPFDSLYGELKSAGADTLKFRIGDLAEEVETELLTVKEGSFSIPLYINDGWYIGKIVKKNYPLLAKLTGWEVEFKRLEQVAKDRAEEKFYNDFMAEYFKDKKINANGYLLKSVAQKIAAVFEKKSVARKSDQEKLFLDIPDLIYIEGQFDSDSLNLPYIFMENKQITLREFLRYFRSESFTSTKYDVSSVTFILNSKTKKFIEQEFLAEEGYKRGLNNAREVRESFNMWKENYLYQVRRASFADSANISEEEILNEYNRISKEFIQPVEVKLIEILTDDLTAVELIINDLQKNADMRELAKKYSKRILTRNNGGELGFFPVTNYGEIGRIAGQMEIGEVYGPLKIDEGYSIFKLIDRREEEKILPAGYESTKNELKNYLAQNKMYLSIVDHTVKLADKYGVEVNSDLLKTIKPSNTTSLIFRNLGFGGRITAVPFITPDNTWVKYWRENASAIQ